LFHAFRCASSGVAFDPHDEEEVIKMERGYAVESAFFKQLIEHSSDLIQGLTLDGSVTYCCPAFGKMLGCPAESFLGTDCSSWIHEEDVPKFRQAFNQMTQGLMPFILEYRYLRQDGSSLWVQGKASFIYEGDITVGIGLIARDITRYKINQEKLTQMAYYDSLTGLPNRRLFQDRYTQAYLSAKRHQHNLAVLYLDLDNFKLINDNYGHVVGDELLKMVAARLLNSVREHDTVCRLGGDEFIILLQQFDNTADVEKVAQRALDALNSRFLIHQREITITCSMGTAVYSQGGIEGEDLIESADHAMYQAKRYGKN
jgi:diguanylate cyclase (GGDEF)-like protein/PAS domain S-box-containing protein